MILAACQAIVGNQLPKVSCVPESSGCPSGTACDPDTNTCLKVAAETTDDIATKDSQPAKKKDASSDSATDATTPLKALGSVCLGDAECES